MESVDDDLGIGEKGARDVEEAPVHVHDHIFHLAAVGKGAQVVLNDAHVSGGEDVQRPVVRGIGDDALKALASGVPLELVERDGLWQPARLRDSHHLQYPLHAADGGTGILRDVLHAAAPAQQSHDLLAGAVHKAHIPSDEVVPLGELLAAARTDVSPPAVSLNQRLPPQLQIPYFPDTVIMHPVRLCMTPRTRLRFLKQGDPQYDLPTGFLELFDPHLFHFQQFCAIIFLG